MKDDRESSQEARHGDIAVSESAERQDVIVKTVLEEFEIAELEDRLEFDGWCGGWDVNFFC